MLESIKRGEFNTGIDVFLKNQHRIEIDENLVCTESQSNTIQFLSSPQIYLEEFIDEDDKYGEAMDVDSGAILQTTTTREGTTFVEEEEEEDYTQIETTNGEETTINQLYTFLGQLSSEQLGICIHYLNLKEAGVTKVDIAKNTIINHFKEYPEAAIWSIHLLSQLLTPQQINTSSMPKYDHLFSHLTSVKGLNMTHLKYSLRFFGLQVTGKKKILIERLVKHILGFHRCTYVISWKILASTAAQDNDNIIHRFQRTTVDSKPYNGGMLSMRYVFLQLLDNAFLHNLFIDDLPKEITIPFLIYDDATSELTWPVYASLLGFINDPGIFKETASDEEVLSLKPWFVALAPETKDICNQIDKIKSAELREVVLHPFFINHHKITLKLKLLCADHSRQWKNIQNKCGGHHRCDKCGVSFKNLQSKNLWLSSLQRSSAKKSLWQSYLAFHLEEILPPDGSEGLPALFNAFIDDERDVVSSVFKGVITTCDNLHNTKGILQSIVEAEKKEEYFQKGLLLERIYSVLGKKNLSDMNCRDWRACALQYREILLPCVGKDRQKPFTLIMDTWNQIQQILYLPTKAQKYKRIRLRLWILLFNLPKLMLQLWKKNIMGLYLHDVIAHFGEYFEQMDFSSGSTERGERFLGDVKRMLKHHTNRHPEDVSRQLFRMFHFRNIASVNRLSKNENKKTKTHQLNAKWKPTELFWSKEFYKKYSRECDALLGYLTLEHNYLPDTHWVQTNGEIKFHTLDSGDGFNAFLTHNNCTLK